MFGLGMQELLIITLVVVVLFGATRLPQIGEGMGKMITNFRRSMKEVNKPEEEEASGEPAEPEKIQDA